MDHVIFLPDMFGLPSQVEQTLPHSSRSPESLQRVDGWHRGVCWNRCHCGKSFGRRWRHTEWWLSTRKRPWRRENGQTFWLWRLASQRLEILSTHNILLLFWHGRFVFFIRLSSFLLFSISVAVRVRCQQCFEYGGVESVQRWERVYACAQCAVQYSTSAPCEQTSYLLSR